MKYRIENRFTWGKRYLEVLEMNSSVPMAASSPAIPPSPHSCFAPGFSFYQVYKLRAVHLGLCSPK
ncbi:hypothetical protein EZ456_00375 [Pedobacter psychrodurus]|uniref:Uncharacterized protein n=1 Tax=Pedobacter psychrodurus TaxID=2530456 RepID=A0A4R0Q103_9SPHI|nr:hypothetical protein [Pedobacter psychrodurus]TCD29508.1 hypothetical protein EZ456_00375 [Pedobacter psychrodurus]